MERIERTVFISYRRTNIPWALAIFQNLTHHGYDVFFDYSGIASGDFERVIIGNIKARAHFLVLLNPSTLERCGDPADWLRREIETALVVRRNIVPLTLEGFDFSAPEIASQLTGTLTGLRRYNALPVFAAYFEEAMGRLRERFLNVPLDAVLHPVSPFAQRTTLDQQAAAQADLAIQERELTAQEWSERGRIAADLKDDALAVRCLLKAVDAGDARGMNGLGAMYFNGRGGLPKDNAQAVNYFRKAAEAGSASGMTNLGIMYENGRGGLPKDDEQAMGWYRKAAEAGDAMGMAALGFMYESGRGGLPKDDAQCVIWFRKAAEAGDAASMSNLGFMYEHGKGGLLQDDGQAVNWYREAAEAGDAMGMHGLGFMYLNGRGGLPKDDVQAATWFRKATEAGEARGMIGLGFMYENGRGGLPEDEALAVNWYRKAADDGEIEAQRALERLGRR
jgi:TPR repeat protein